MFAATTRPWYLPTWVSGQMPVTSPIAHKRSPARICASTGIPRPSTSMPTVSRPMSATRGRRPVAARDGLHARRLAIGPDAVELTQPRDRRDERVRAARHHDMLGGMAHAVDLHDARPGQPAAAAQQVDALTLQPALLAGVGVLG